MKPCHLLEMLFPLMQRDFAPVSVRGEREMLIFPPYQLFTITLHMHTDTQPPQIIHSAMAQIATHKHKHTLAVLSLPLVLTAHQSPISACCNMLTPAISLKSLSIRGSCAGPSTLCKLRVWDPPTQILRAHTHICRNERTHCMLTPFLHKPSALAHIRWG